MKYHRKFKSMYIKKKCEIDTQLNENQLFIDKLDPLNI